MSYDHKKVLVLWSLRDGQTLDSFSLDSPSNTTTCMDFNSKEEKIALGTVSGSVILFSIQTNEFEVIRIIKPNIGFGPVRVVKFDHEGKNLATGHDTGTCEVSYRILILPLCMECTLLLFCKISF